MIILRNIRRSQYREYFLFSFGWIATRHVIMIDVASGGGGEESTCRWDMREHERTFNHTVANFFFAKRRFSSFRNTACVLFCFLPSIVFGLPIHPPVVFDTRISSAKDAEVLSSAGNAISRASLIESEEPLLHVVATAAGRSGWRVLISRFYGSMTSHHVVASKIFKCKWCILRSGDNVVLRAHDPFVTVLL